MERKNEVLQKAEFLRALQEMRGAGAVAQNEQDDLLHKYGSTVDNDVRVSPSQACADSLVRFLQTIPGFELTEKIKNSISNPKNIAASSLAVRTNILRKSQETWVEVDITLNGTEQIPMRVDFRRVSNMKGVGLRLEFDNQANFLGGEVTDDYWIDRDGLGTHGTLNYDKNGLILGADGSFSDIERTKINIPRLVHKMISEKGLNEGIDPKKFI